MRPASTAILVGQSDGKALLEIVKIREEQFGSDEERLLWWAAFFGYLGGLCAASLGPGALQAIEAMTHQTTSQVLREHVN